VALYRVEYKVGKRLQKSHNYSVENGKGEKSKWSSETDLDWVELIVQMCGK